MPKLKYAIKSISNGWILFFDDDDIFCEDLDAVFEKIREFECEEEDGPDEGDRFSAQPD